MQVQKDFYGMVFNMKFANTVFMISMLLVVIIAMTALIVFARTSFISSPEGRSKAQPTITRQEEDIIRDVKDRHRITRSKDYIDIINQKLREGEIDISNCTGTIIERINRALLNEC